MKKRFLFATLVGFAALPARAEIIDGVAAIANGEVITLSEVEEHVGAGLPPDSATGEAKDHRDSMLKRAADDLVTDKLVSKECKEQNLEPTSAEIDNAIEDVEHANHIDKPTLEKALVEQGLTFERYRSMLTDQLCRMKVVEMKVKNRVQVTDDDVKNALANQGGGGLRAFEMKISDIYVLLNSGESAARTKILEAQARVAKGDEFTQVAREFGGGDLGWMKEADLAPELLKAVSKLQPGGVTPIVKTSSAFHLLKLTDRRQSTDAESIAKRRDGVRSQIFAERMERATTDYLAELKRNAETEIRVP